MDLTGAAVLDLYAGSGALGLEAMSRGAASAVFVESDERAAAVIAQNIAELGVEGATVRRGTVTSVLAAGTDRAVDLVLADPPYELGADEVDAVLAGVATGGWTRSGTFVVVERPSSSLPLTWPDNWSAWPHRRYGDTRIEMAEADRRAGA
jgi:16S rRNA (guanine(966)-N(2))-methyltransferase RsmD